MNIGQRLASVKRVIFDRQSIQQQMVTFIQQLQQFPPLFQHLQNNPHVLAQLLQQFKWKQEQNTRDMQQRLNMSPQMNNQSNQQPINQSQNNNNNIQTVGGLIRTLQARQLQQQQQQHQQNLQQIQQIQQNQQQNNQNNNQNNNNVNVMNTISIQPPNSSNNSGLLPALENEKSSQPIKPIKKQKLSLFAQRMLSKQNKNKNNNISIDQQMEINEPNEQKNDIITASITIQNNDNDNNDENNNENNMSFIKKLNVKENIVTTDDINNIGAENERFLQSHNESEIMDMRQQLLSSLDPQLIALLTGKKTQKSDKKHKKKIKVSYDMEEEKDEIKSQPKTHKTAPKSSVIRKLKPLKPKRPLIETKNKQVVPKIVKNDAWIHPAKQIEPAIDTSIDNNTTQPGPTQKQKMEWMEPLNIKDEKAKYRKNDATPLMLGDNPMAYYRFGFDGRVLCNDKGIINENENENIILSGLHHHGDEPLKPGYTINELIHLSKSSVSNQRNTAIKTLMYIVQQMRCGKYGMEYSEYLWILLQENNLVQLIIDVLGVEKNVSCIIPILDFMHAIFVPIRILFNNLNNNKINCYASMTNKLIYDGFHILCNTLPNVTADELNTNQSLFGYFNGKDDEKKQYETGSFAQRKMKKKSEMTDIWKCDVILAVCRKTKCIKYLNNVMMKYVVADDANDMYIKNILPSLLDVIMAFVMHHPEIVDLVLGQMGFMDNLMKIVLDNKIEWIYKCKIIDIISIMCQMNKNCIEYLVKYNKLNDFKAFIVEGIDFSDVEEKLFLSIASFDLWRICIKFGYDFDAFNDLLPKLIGVFSNFTMKFEQKKDENDKIFQLQQRQTRALLNVIDVLLENLIPENLRRLPRGTTVSWNQIAKLTEKCIAVFDKIVGLDGNIMRETDYICIGGLVYIISTYFKTLREQNDETVGQLYDNLFGFAKQQCMKLCKKYIATWSIPKQNNLLCGLLLNKRNWTYGNTITEKDNKLMIEFPFLDGLLCDIPLSIAVMPNDEYLSKCDYLLGIIKMVESFVKINSKIIPVLVQSKFIDSIGRILLQITNKHFHFRLNRSLRSLLFNYWRIEFLLAYHILSLCGLCKADLSEINTVNNVNIHSSACVLLECIPPGYQHLADKLLNKYILSRNYLPILKKLSIKYLKKSENSKELLNGKLTTFYIESDINSFHRELINIYTKQDKYLPNVFNRKIRNLSHRNHSYSNVSRINSLCCIPIMIPTFWLLQPMINLYKHKINNNSITNLLHFYFILSKCYNDDFMDEIITFDSDNENENENNSIKSHHYWCNIAVWDIYRTIGTLYLCDSNIYLNKLNKYLIYELMEQCWNRIYYCENNKNNKNEIYLCDKNDPSSACIIDYDINEISNNFNIKSLGREWEGFYTRLIEQFQSDSFGDELFGKLILFQLQNNYNKQFRTILWTQIDSLGLLLKNIYPPVYKWKSFFIPFEKDKIILEFQFESVSKNQTHLRNLADCNNSFLYFIAIVQLSHYVWIYNNKKKKKGKNSIINSKNVKRNMLNNILNQCEKSVIIDIVNCDFTNIDSLVIQNSNECINELKEFLNIGKNKIVINDNNKNRVSVLKSDFADVCNQLSLF